MTIYVNQDDLPEPQFNLTDKHQKLLHAIHTRKSDLSADFQSAPERTLEAFTWVKNEAKKKSNFSEEDICSIHKKLEMNGEYRVREFESIVVWNGTVRPYSPPAPENLSALMNKFIKRFSSNKKNREPLEWICEMYLLFELIHPFKDGNGRTGRLLCSWKMFNYSYEFLASYLEKRWGNNKKHPEAFRSSTHFSYVAWQAHPRDFNEFCSNFYLYFLEEIVAIIESKNPN